MALWLRCNAGFAKMRRLLCLVPSVTSESLAYSGG